MVTIYVANGRSIGIGTLIIIIGIVISLSLDQPLLGIVVTLVIAVLLGGGIWLRMRQNGRAVPSSTNERPVLKVEGIIQLKDWVDHDEHGGSRKHRLEIEHHTFQLFHKEQFEALKNGALYAIYYFEDDDQYILSLEKIS